MAWLLHPPREGVFRSPRPQHGHVGKICAPPPWLWLQAPRPLPCLALSAPLTVLGFVFCLAYAAMHQMPQMSDQPPAGPPPSDVSATAVAVDSDRLGPSVWQSQIAGWCCPTSHEEANLPVPGASLLRARATVCTPANMALHGRGEATAGTLSGGGGTTRWSSPYLGRRRPSAATASPTD